eukprot:CAMPEP_0119346658 /NCGR_PEP_ID=MMETSP1333-20130426/108118_1 /TAXON_ID=418940 /ORGANISM="Scyphosphaera apsteinii, Strain RCC1455" /LENGTH=55 /DNA_ID=CAMNT_0007359169 /DNA_START=568 /DNA_END=735 /DNA_ORIENTATION=-
MGCGAAGGPATGSGTPGMGVSTTVPISTGCGAAVTSAFTGILIKIKSVQEWSRII